jgi:MFS family permease
VLLAEYLRRRLAQEEEPEEPVSKGLVVLHALVAAAPIVPSVLIAYLVTQHRLPAGRPIFIAITVGFAIATAIALTLASRFRWRMLRFVTVIPVVLSVWATVKFGSTAIDRTLSARPLSKAIAEAEMHRLPFAVYGVSREMEYGLTFYRNQMALRYERSGVPTEEHLLVAPAAWKVNVAERTAGRRVLLLANYAPQDVDYYWVSAAGVEP